MAFTSTLIKFSPIALIFTLLGCQPSSPTSIETNNQNTPSTSTVKDANTSTRFYGSPKNHDEFYNLLKANYCFPINVSGSNEGMSTEYRTQGRGASVSYDLYHLKFAVFSDEGLTDSALRFASIADSDRNAGPILISTLPILYICTKSKHNIETNYLYVDFFLSKNQLKDIYTHEQIENMKLYPKQSFKY